MKVDELKNVVLYYDVEPVKAIHLVYNAIFPLFGEKKHKMIQMRLTNGLDVDVSFDKNLIKNWHIYISDFSLGDEYKLNEYHYDDNDWPWDFDSFEETVLKYNR